MSRNRTVERRREREREKRRQQQITGVVILVALAVIAALALILANQPAEAPISAESAERYAGIPLGKTDEGFPRLGNPDAPVKVVEYSSFSCTACKSFHDAVTPSIIERVRAGEVVFTYVPMYTTGSVQNGQGAALAAVCAGEQDKFWEFHDALFDWQGLYANQAFANNRLETGIDNLGINRGQWDQCMGSELPGRVIREAEQSARNLPGFEGTPTITVNGILVTPDLASVTRAIDEELAKLGGVPEATVEATTEATAPTVETTPEATAEATTAP
ncbi:MAG: thioredoxin domain-containing protein [Chloroflexi bacterium]|nr:thioredoxin domain-containing protein [Chloroflexota bacterium]